MVAVVGVKLVGALITPVPLAVLLLDLPVALVVLQDRPVVLAVLDFLEMAAEVVGLAGAQVEQGEQGALVLEVVEAVLALMRQEPSGALAARAM